MPALATDWASSSTPVPYPEAVAFMQQRAAAIASGQAPELVWLLEHPPLYTAGNSTRPEDRPAPARFPVFETGRGGQLTYHGPGQRICYLMLNVKARTGDVRAFVSALEDWIIASLADLGVRGETRSGRVGVWVARPDRGHSAEDKIAAIGLRLTRWVSLHGISLNVDPDLSHYDGIVPCGISEHGVTSLADLGAPRDMPHVDAILRRQFERRFGPTQDATAPSIGKSDAFGKC
ncbi:lipoyl(octanoyl) transferase LipB [Hyphomicrobium sp. D-2]|uniref:lipoyl(octanoyl) transferase LipB n=1 Tax=Hyphomicrobium sp. D-2 TaxID=3041621 RepID=UPI002456D5EC|nr:lipoyl(octanoyl) transferase LipB [Hyphomicrobium sp. D-2]MDH4982940.1 lipoyl(octanoyl) transferase LipB [Hyphomicrobium sp. D-2]